MSNYILDNNNYSFNYYQYKKNITKKINFSFYLIFFIIILLLGLCVFLYPKPKNFSEFYFVEIDNFQTYKQAINLSQTISKSGGAGYIYFDGTYHVLASFYSDINDAEKVTENLQNEYPSARVFTIECNHFYTQKNLSSSQNNSIKNIIDTTKKIILQLENLSFKFDTNKATFHETIMLVKKHTDTFTSVFDELLNNFKTNSKFNKAKEHAQNMKKALTNLSSSDEQTLSTNLRYTVVDIAITLTQFSSSV